VSKSCGGEPREDEARLACHEGEVVAGDCGGHVRQRRSNYLTQALVVEHVG
jgi:hypothetical protein